MQNILIGITGGIAASKIPILIRLLKKSNYQVKVCTTNNANLFVTETTLKSLSGNSVVSDLSSPLDENAMDHINLVRWADLIIIAPATANFIAKAAHGIADDLLTTLILAIEPSKPKIIVPSMNSIMWEKPSLKRNVLQLKSDDWQVLPVDIGEQACGEYGYGRMLEPERIFSYINDTNYSTNILENKKVLISAGPTREPIDPVRFISNYSSGKMGYALASAANLAGAQVVLVSGPVSIDCPKVYKRVMVETARQMQDSVMKYHDWCDIYISSAAVTDYRPRVYKENKIKKDKDNCEIEVIKNNDILLEFSSLKKTNQYIVGFAAETDNLLGNATAKLNTKDIDMVVANIVSSDKKGFCSDDNEVIIITNDGDEISIPKKKKIEVARDIIENIAIKYNKTKHY